MARAAALLAEAEGLARDRIEQGEETPSLRVELAAVAALRRDEAAALDWLARAYDTGYRDYGFIEHDPILAPLAGHARFREIIDRMRRDVAAQRDGARERGLLDLTALLPRAR